MKKLVRDKIPDIIKSKGEQCDFYVAENIEYNLELFKKLLEEAKEVEESIGKNQLIEELADVTEVIKSISSNNGISLNDIEKVRLMKFKNKGGFKNRFILQMED